LAAGVQIRSLPTSVKWYIATWKQCSSSLDHQRNSMATLCHRRRSKGIPSAWMLHFSPTP